MVIAQEMGCNHNYGHCCCRRSHTSICRWCISEGHGEENAEHQACASRASTFSANLHKRHLTTVRELHTELKDNVEKANKLVHLKGEKAISLL